MTTNRLLDDLNEYQREAVETTEGPLLIIAGAGSGKTRVLTRRLAYLLVNRLAEPYQVLAVTFTNKAAGEMRARVAEVMGLGFEHMSVSTFHSFSSRLLRYEAEAIGYPSNFTIFDQADSLSLVKKCIKELGFAEKQFPPKGQMRLISDAKGKLLTSDAFQRSAEGYFETRTAELYSLYQRRLFECGAMDFDDLLFNSVQLLQKREDISERYRKRFKYLMVDEYQDTNRIQYMLLKLLLDNHNNICVVGDEDQSIYGWRGADIQNILGFETDFPGAKIIKLEQNYRSTQVILDAASSVIENNDMRKGKKLWTDSPGGEKLALFMVDDAHQEANAVIDEIINLKGQTPLKGMVILYRTNAQSRPFEEKLRRANIPYQIVGGLSFYQRKEIKNLLAYLKLIANPRDDISFERIINYPRRGLGQKSVNLVRELARGESCPFFEIISRVSDYTELLRPSAKLCKFAEMIQKFQKLKSEQPVDLLIQDLIDELDLIEELLAEDQTLGRGKVENIEVFIEGAAEFARTRAEATLDEYLADISLFTDLDSYAGIDDKVTLMTVHSAKGLEYATVFIVGLEEGLFPLQRAANDPLELEEERRLFYVAATRACKKLCLTFAGTRFRFGDVASIPSRFINEIPSDLIEKRDLRKRGYETIRRYKPTDNAVQTHLEPLPRPLTQAGVHYEYEENEVLREGRIVSHPTFGRGKVLSVQGFGDSLTLEIMFSGLGVKKIMAKYARLKVVG